MTGPLPPRLEKAGQIVGFVFVVIFCALLLVGMALAVWTLARLMLISAA